MAARKKRRRRSGYVRDYVMSDNLDGLEINRFNKVSRVAKRTNKASIFDRDNICVEMDHKVYGRRFHRVSISGEARLANSSKTEKINGYKDNINKRSLF